MCTGMARVRLCSWTRRTLHAPLFLVFCALAFSSCDSSTKSMDTMERDGILKTAPDAALLARVCFALHRQQSLIDPLERFVPAYSAGVPVGFRVFPGSDPLFRELGIRKNDLLTSVNGVSLADRSLDLAEIEARVTRSGQVDVRFMRDGRPRKLSVNLVDKPSECRRVRTSGDSRQNP